MEIHTLKDQWDQDDHNVGSFLVLPDNRLMAFYARHNKQGLYCCTSTLPEDINRWDDEVIVSDTPRISYNHPLYLSDEKTFYVFWRGPSWKPTYATSRDGRAWSEPKILIQGEGKSAENIRPYTKIVSDGKSAIHFAFTDGHPQNEEQNSVYYMRYQGGSLFGADDTLIGTLDTLPISHSACNKVYDGSSAGRAWVWDIALDERGYPVIAYTRVPVGTDHRLCYARWNGTSWQDNQIVAAGKWFPQTPDGQKETESYYSGGMGLDPADPSTLYLSRQVDNVFEIERWHTTDQGSTWSSATITSGSKSLNVRPVVPRGYAGDTPLVLWMYGNYEHYTSFRTGIKLLVSEG